MGDEHRSGAESSVGSVNNIQLFREARGWSRPALAQLMDTSPQQIERLEKGQRTLRPEWIDRAAQAFGVSPADIISPAPAQSPDTGCAPKPEKSVGITENDEPDEVTIQEWDVAYGMGGGTYMDLPVTGTLHTFSRSWLRNFTHAPPEKIFLARGTGDSMFPTILDGDIVVIDTSEREIRIGDKIWAVVYGTTGYIKRIRPMPDGSVKMLSDNQNVPPETAYDGELSVVGRVVAVVRKT